MRPRERSGEERVVEEEREAGKFILRERERLKEIEKERKRGGR